VIGRQVLSILLVAGLVVGCMNVSSTVTVRPDGSGTITERVTIGSELASMIRGMEQADDSAGTSNELFSKTEVQARADSLSGLRLTSMERISTRKKEGYEALYAFDNLNEAQLSPTPEDVMPDQAPDQGGGGGPSELLSQVDLSYTPGTPATLTITMPRDTSGDDGMTGGSFPMDTSGEGPPSDQEMRMMRRMMRDSGFQLAVTLDGTIVETNATHRLGSTVTLMGIDFGPLAQDSTAFRRLMVDESNRQPASPQAAIDSLNALPGITIEPRETVTIRFQ